MLYDQLFKVLPIVLIIPLAYCLKKMKLFDKDFSVPLNKIFIDLSLPASVFLAFASITLTLDLLKLPLYGFLVVFLLMLIGFVVVFIVRPKKNIYTVFLVMLPAMATAVVAYPFFIELYGQQGLAVIALINVGNVFFLFTFDRYLSYKLANKKPSSKQYFFSFIETPSIWAIVLGLLFSYFAIRHMLFDKFFEIIANATVFITMFSIGLSFEYDGKIIKQALPLVLIKTGAGLLAGYAIVTLFNLEGLSRLAIMVYSIVPASAVVFAFVTEDKLDKVFCADLLSIALPLGALLVAGIMIFPNIMQTVYVLPVGAALFIMGLLSMVLFDK